MLKFVQATLVSLTFLGLLASQVQARNISEIKKTGTLIVGVNGASPPFQYKASNQFAGYEIEIAKMIAKQLGAQPVFVEQPNFGELEKMLLNDKVDITINTHPSTSTRAKEFGMSIPYACLAASILTTEANVKTQEDILDKRVAVVKDTIFQDYAKKLKLNKPLTEYNTMNEAIAAFVSGKTEVGFTWKSQIPFFRKVLKPDLQDTPVLWSIPVAFLTQPKNNSTIIALNNAIAKIRHDPAYAALNAKAFPGDNVSCSR